MDKTFQCNSILSPIIVTPISCRYRSYLLNYVRSSGSQQLTRTWIIFNLSFSQENIWTNHTYLQLTASIPYTCTKISCISITNFWQDLMLTCFSIMLSHELAHWLCLACHNGFVALKVKCSPLPHTNRYACLRDVFQILDHSTELFRFTI